MNIKYRQPTSRYSILRMECLDAWRMLDKIDKMDRPARAGNCGNGARAHPLCQPQV